MAPLSLFQPELFGVTGPKVVHIQQRAGGDPEDPHDENYLRETSVSCDPCGFLEFTYIFETLILVWQEQLLKFIWNMPSFYLLLVFQLQYERKGLCDLPLTSLARHLGGLCYF